MAKPTPEEIELISQFRHAIKDLQMTPEQSQDHELLRWIRARNRDLEKAEQMLRKSMQWRKEHGMEDLASWEPPKEIAESWPILHVGHDEENSPIMISYAGRAKIVDMLRLGLKEDLVKYPLHHYEKLLKNAKNTKTSEGHPVTQLILIVDFEGFSMTSLLVSGFTALWMDLVNILEANYPETVKNIVGTNSNRLVTILYNLAKPFLSEDTCRKLVVCGKEGAPNLRESFLPHIPPEEICSRFGGTKPCDFAFCCEAPIPSTPSGSLEKSASRDLENIPPKFARKYEVPVEISDANSVLHWSFQTQGYDTYFGVKFNGNSVLPLRPLDTQLDKVEGSVICEQPGKYVLEFHNSYRKTKSRDVMCSVNYVNVCRPQVT